MGNVHSQDGKRKTPLRRPSNLSVPKFVSKKSSMSISSGRSSTSKWTINENDSITTMKPPGLLGRIKPSAPNNGDTNLIIKTDDQSDLDLMYYSKREEERKEMFEKFAENQIIMYKQPRPLLLNDDNDQNKAQDNNNNLIDNTQTKTALSNKRPLSQHYSSEKILSELYMQSERSMERRRERDRRHRQHYLLKRIWGSNYKIPLESPSLIVDWCCATAVWDIELAFEFPTAKVIGIDYESATMTSLSNTIKNFRFLNAALHKGENGLSHLKDNQVDYIIMRDIFIINTPVNKWNHLFDDIMRVLKPGGYIEIYEQDTSYTSMGPHFKILEQWSDRTYEEIGLDRSTCHELGSLLKQSGFINIQEQTIKVPIGEWSDIQELKETGYFQKDIVERKFSDTKHWHCKINSINEKRYQSCLIKAMDECDTFHTSVSHLYFSGQKPL